jgi:hypothetical protein
MEGEEPELDYSPKYIISPIFEPSSSYVSLKAVSITVSPKQCMNNHQFDIDANILSAFLNVAAREGDLSFVRAHQMRPKSKQYGRLSKSIAQRNQHSCLSFPSGSWFDNNYG